METKSTTFVHSCEFKVEASCFHTGGGMARDVFATFDSARFKSVYNLKVCFIIEINSNGCLKVS